MKYVDWDNKSYLISTIRNIINYFESSKEFHLKRLFNNNNFVGSFDPKSDYLADQLFKISEEYHEQEHSIGK